LEKIVYPCIFSHQGDRKQAFGIIQETMFFKKNTARASHSVNQEIPYPAGSDKANLFADEIEMARHDLMLACLEATRSASNPADIESLSEQENPPSPGPAPETESKVFESTESRQDREIAPLSPPPPNPEKKHNKTSHLRPSILTFPSTLPLNEKNLKNIITEIVIEDISVHRHSQ